MTVADLLETRERTIDEIHRRSGAEAPRRFLTTFHELEPEWEAIGFDHGLGDLPAVRWKRLNLERPRAANPTKYGEQLDKLRECLDGRSGA